MRIVSERVCGMNVHKNSITACVLLPRQKEICTFGTMTEDLFTLLHWIREHGCTHVAMESTGVYWKPVYNLLEADGAFEVYVVNAGHIKQVPGRKTDMKDAEWIADLLQHGLLRPSFIPDRPQRELRELVRYRRSMTEERAREANRIQKVLEGANIKLGSVATDVLGTSGRAILRSFIAGEVNPQVLADLSKGVLRKKKSELESALRGLIASHQRFMLQHQLEHIEFLEQRILLLDQEIAERLAPFKDDLDRLDSIPGIGCRAAEQVLAEFGTDISRFPSANHLTSWAGLAPGQNESAGRSRSTPTKKGNKCLKSALVEAAQSAVRVKDTYLRRKYNRIKKRRGSQRAFVAIARTLLIIMYHLLTRKEMYREQTNLYEERIQEIRKNQALKHLKKLGYEVSLSPQHPA